MSAVRVVHSWAWHSAAIWAGETAEAGGRVKSGELLQTGTRGPEPTLGAMHPGLHWRLGNVAFLGLGAEAFQQRAPVPAVHKTLPSANDTGEGAAG